MKNHMKISSFMMLHTKLLCIIFDEADKYIRKYDGVS